MDKLKYVKLEHEDGSYSDSVPLSVDADYVDVGEQKLTTVLNNKASKEEVAAVASGSPAGVYSTIANLTTADPDHSKIYVVAEDGNWYYYSGNTWVSGGVYQSSINPLEVEEISDAVDKILTTSNINIYNFRKTINNKNINYSGDPVNNSDYWITDFIEINPTIKVKTSILFYRVFMYDENQTHLGYYGADKSELEVTDIREGTQYVRFVFRQSVCLFENNQNIIIRNNDEYESNYQKENCFVVDTNRIKNDSISLVKLNKNFRLKIIDECIKNGIMFLTVDDLKPGRRISDETGVIWSSSKYVSYLNYDFIQFKARTKFMFNSTDPYQFRIFYYNEDGSFLEASSKNLKSLTLQNDSYIRIEIHKTDDSVITTEDIIDMLDKFSIKYIPETTVEDEIDNINRTIDGMMAKSDINIFNYIEAINNKNIDFSGNAVNNADYWISGYIEIDTTLQTHSSKQFFRAFMYDENKTYLGYYGANKSLISVSDYSENTKYIRFVFNKSTVDFEDASIIIVWNNNNTMNPYMIENYLLTDTIGIKTNSITLPKLNQSFRLKIIDQCIKNDIMFLTAEDLQWRSINPSTGAPYDANSKVAYLNWDFIKFKAGTTFYIPAPYGFRFFYYNADGTIKSYTSPGQRRVILGSDQYIKFEIAKADGSNITSEDKIDILSKLKINYQENEFIYYGDPINIKKNVARWRAYPSSEMLSQDICIYKDELFTFEAANIHKFKVINLLTGEAVGPFDIPADLTDAYPNCNVATFGGLKYDDADEYPLLYLSYWQTGHYGECGVYRVQRSEQTYTMTYLYSIEIDAAGTFAVDPDYNYIYAICHSPENHVNRVYKFNMPTEATRLLRAEALLTFDMSFNANHQGMQFYQGKIYQSVGASSTDEDSYINVGDCYIGKEVSRIWLKGIFTEPQKVAFYNNELIAGSKVFSFD